MAPYPNDTERAAYWTVNEHSAVGMWGLLWRHHPQTCSSRLNLPPHWPSMVVGTQIDSKIAHLMWFNQLYRKIINLIGIKVLIKIVMPPRGDGALTLGSGMGMCRPQDPLFKPLFRSGDQPFSPCPFLCPPFSIFRNIWHFQAKFRPILAKFQLRRHQFWRKFVPKTLLF